MNREIKILATTAVIFLLVVAWLAYFGSIFEGLSFWNIAVILILVVLAFIAVRPFIDKLMNKTKL